MNAALHLPKPIEDVLRKRGASTSRRNFLRASGALVISLGFDTLPGDHALAAQASPPAQLGALDTSNDNNGNGGNGRLDTITAVADRKAPAASRGD